MSTNGRHARYLLAVWALAAASPAAAETLTEAWALADAQDNGLAAVRSQAEAAELDAGAARAQPWPTLAVGGAYTRLDSTPAFDFGQTGVPMPAPQLFGGNDFWMGAATLTVPLFTSGRISSDIAAAEARGRGAGAQAQGAREDVKLAVAEAYVSVLRARKALAVATAT